MYFWSGRCCNKISVNQSTVERRLLFIVCVPMLPQILKLCPLNGNRKCFRVSISCGRHGCVFLDYRTVSVWVNCSLCRFAQLAAVELLTQRTGDSNSSDEELDASNIKFFERHGVEGSTDSKEDLILDKAEKRDARSKHCLTSLLVWTVQRCWIFGCTISANCHICFLL